MLVIRLRLDFESRLEKAESQVLTTLIQIHLQAWLGLGLAAPYLRLRYLQTIRYTEAIGTQLRKVYRSRDIIHATRLLNEGQTNPYLTLSGKSPILVDYEHGAGGNLSFPTCSPRIKWKPRGRNFREPAQNNKNGVSHLGGLPHGVEDSNQASENIKELNRLFKPGCPMRNVRRSRLPRRHRGGQNSVSTCFRLDLKISMVTPRSETDLAIQHDQGGGGERRLDDNRRVFMAIAIEPERWAVINGWATTTAFTRS
ncbi:hypothetical protein FB451DRAFT_1198115 [Mycena latifolia]|nr:hypothetical protein FB451DRAFT_1198115 [Mycena latifolia]